MTGRPLIMTVVGARPQFVKAAPVSRALARAGLSEILVHTGQHYDWEMSQAFFEGLSLPAPAVNLEVGSGPHGQQTGRMLSLLESTILERQPQFVLVYGDTNSTLAGALAAAKLYVPVMHVEAGLRSFNRKMPEEVNRVVTDHLAAVNFAPTQLAVSNLQQEGITENVFLVGDVMLDLARETEASLEDRKSSVLGPLGLTPSGYVVATIHRPENTDDPSRWKAILESVRGVAEEVAPVVWPIHPRVRHQLPSDLPATIKLVPPAPYLEMQTLVRFASAVITDSGGLQKEAAFRQTPCVTLRPETEWRELVECGLNVLVEPDRTFVVQAVRAAKWPGGDLPPHLYGNGHAADAISQIIDRRHADARRDP